MTLATALMAGLFLLSSCHDDDDYRYAPYNHTHTGWITQTYIYYLDNILLTSTDQPDVLTAEVRDLEGEIYGDDAVLIYECTDLGQDGTTAYWTLLPYTRGDYTLFCQSGDNGYLYFDAIKNNGNWTTDLQLGTVKVVLIPHEVEITMRSKGIDLSNYNQVARFCNLPADDISALKAVSSL